MNVKCHDICVTNKLTPKTMENEMKLVENIKKDEELANQILELDESEHSDVKMQQLLNIESMADNIDRYVFVMKSVEAKIDFLKDQKKQLDAFIKSLESKQEKFRQYITMHLLVNDIQEAIGLTKKISLQSRSSIQFDEDVIDRKYFTEKKEMVLDKEKILMDMAKDVKVLGVTETTKPFIKTFNNSTNKVGVLIKKEVKNEIK